MRFFLRRCAAGACLALLAAFSLATLSFQVPAARAQSSVQDSLVREAISEDVAVALVREQTDGKVVRVDRKMEGSDVFYRVRVLTPDGRLRDYRVDAATGAVR